MKKFRAAAAPLALTFLLAGCSDSAKKTFGLEANPPEAFDVGTQAPLSLPPELGTLPPPNPGEPRPQQVDAAQAGADVLNPENAITPAPSTLSPGAQALLAAAGPPPPPGIRAEVNQKALIASKPPSFVSKLLGTAATPPPTVDASAEAHRIQEEEALGQPVDEGATPQESASSPNIFQRIFSAF